MQIYAFFQSNMCAGKTLAKILIATNPVSLMGNTKYPLYIQGRSKPRRSYL